MRLVFFRHGEGPGLSLGELGQAQVEVMTRYLPIKPSIVYSSPYEKAVETSRIIAKVKKASYTTIPELSPAIASFENIAKHVKDNAVFVGHSPSIEAIVVSLIGGGNIRLEPGGFALIEAKRYAHGEGELVLLANPGYVVII